MTMMNSKYSFQADPDLYEWCERVIRVMTQLYDIAEADARTKINNIWATMDFRNDQIKIYLHETDEYWARHFYYDANSPPEI